MDKKRVTVFVGHYGSGKTNIAINYAKNLKLEGKKVMLFDLDTVNPYFRTKDSQKELEELDIKLIVSPFANTNVDIPALPSQMYAAVQDRSSFSVLDIGGDDRGAYALGRLTPMLLEENNLEVLYVVNCYRPLTKTPADALEVLREIEAACGLKATGIVNNSNLAELTTKETILDSLPYISELSKISNLPVKFTCVKNDIKDLCLNNIFYIELQSKCWRNENV